MRLDPADSYEWASTLLARTDPGGALELLTAAWERLLGYGRRELEGKALSELLAADRAADGMIAGAVAAIFDERSMQSVDLTLRCRGGERKSLRLHRRLHASTHTIYIVGEHRSGATGRSPRATAAAAAAACSA